MAKRKTAKGASDVSDERQMIRESLDLARRAHDRCQVTLVPGTGTAHFDISRPEDGRALRLASLDRPPGGR